MPRSFGGLQGSALYIDTHVNFTGCRGKQIAIATVKHLHAICKQQSSSSQSLLSCLYILVYIPLEIELKLNFKNIFDYIIYPIFHLQTYLSTIIINFYQSISLTNRVNIYF